MDYKKVDATIQSFYNYYQMAYEYIDFNFSESQSSHYKQYKNIIYPSMINYMYVGFEHHIKQLYLLVYNHLKTQKDFKFDSSHFRLKDIPPYISEDFIIKDDTLMLNMTESVITYTNNNMTADTINLLFKRIGINSIFDHVNKLNTQEYNTVEFVSEDTMQGRLKFFIKHRNSCSHGIIEEYMGKEILTEWVKFLIDCYNRLFTSLTRLIFSESQWLCFNITKVFNNNIICFENNYNIEITTNSILCYKKDNNYYFYKIKSIKSNNTTIDSTKNYSKIGMAIDPYYESKTLKKDFKIFVVN